MRTPLFSIIFFLKQIIDILSMTPVPANRVPQATKYCNLMMSQLTFLQGFIEDLLDLKQMRDGVFSLGPEPFDPNQVFENICNLLGPQATAKGVEITSSVVKNLILPH